MSSDDNSSRGFIEVLAGLGWREGENLRLVRRQVEFGNAAQVREAAAELAALPVDAIYASSTLGPVGSDWYEAAGGIPLVANGIGPQSVGTRWIQSQARPGGTIRSDPAGDYPKRVDCSSRSCLPPPGWRC